MTPMTPTTAHLLDVERRYLNAPDDGRKDAEVRDRWGLSRVRWAQLVNAALERQEAYEVDPVTAWTLRRRRDARVRSRAARRIA